MVCRHTIIASVVTVIERPSASATSVNDPMNDEAQYHEIDAAMLYIEEARRRAEGGAAKLRDMGAESHLIEAMERAQADLSEAARHLRQGTLFAVPSAQTSL